MLDARHQAIAEDAQMISSTRSRAAASSRRTRGVRSTAPMAPVDGARMRADEHVLQQRHVGEQAQVLEGARDAALDDHDAAAAR